MNRWIKHNDEQLWVNNDVVGHLFATLNQIRYKCERVMDRK